MSDPLQGDDDQELARLRQAFATHSQVTAEECPPPEKTWEAVRGGLSPAETRELVDHIALCASCCDEWRLAAALQQGESAAKVADIGRRAAPAPLPFAPRHRLHPLRGAVLALAAALALTVVGLQVYQRQQAGLTYRGEQAAIHSQVPERVALPRDHFLLRWAAPRGAAVYDVQVSTEDLRVVATAEGLKVPEYKVTASALANLPAGTRLLWKVDATLADGGRLTSPTFVTPIR